MCIRDRGYRMIDEEPRYGAGGASIAFVHPKSTGGVLIEPVSYTHLACARIARRTAIQSLP